MGERLTREGLMAEASTATGLDDYGDLPFHEALDVIVAALEDEAKIDGDRRATAKGTLLGLLSKRLSLVNDRKRFPAIAEEVVKAPLFILGLPRTGSTRLHHLMSQVEGARTPLYWEMNLPSPPPEQATFTTDPRIAQIQAIADNLPAELLKRHPISPQRPEQCNMLNDWSFYHQALLASYEIPSYRDWLLDADYTPALEAHRRTLQHLQWHNPGQWILKYPKHLIALDVLLATYPDARLVWTHRDPAVVVPSVASFTGYMRAQATPGFDPKKYGREWALLEEIVLRRGMAVRARLADEKDRILDVTYAELMADPVGTVEAVSGHAGLPFTEGSRRAVQAEVDAHPKGEHGAHRYTAADFGLDAGRLRKRFDFYIDRFDVPAERVVPA
jgi:hypothetical protein